MKEGQRRGSLVALTPLMVFIGLFFGLSVAVGDFYRVPLGPLFLAASVYAIAIMPKLPVGERIAIFSRGAGAEGMMLMIWIFVMAGSFAATARAMGAVEATVELTMAILPSQLLLPGFFVAACFISLAVGTSVGTIVALTPVAAGIAVAADMSLPLLTAAVVGGAFFGDNLSFISDTTVVSTRTQGCRLSDKFRVNIRIVLPAAVATIIVYVVMGISGGAVPQPEYSVKPLLVLPYVVVLAMAVAGVNVLTVLVAGNVIAGVIGLLSGSFDVDGWLRASADGIAGMAELMLISMLAGGMFEVIRHMGGVEYLIRHMIRFVRGRRGAEAAIALLVSVTNVFTANNTVAILSVGEIAREIAGRFGVDPRKSASLLDTFSCLVQGVLPYGAQLLMAGGLAQLNPVEIVPYLYYPLLMGLCAIGAIWIGWPKMKPAAAQ